jgi:hypothetical protein
MVAKKQVEAEDEVVEDQPVPELRHPSAPGYVLRDGQWVVSDEPEPEAVVELEKPEE